MGAVDRTDMVLVFSYVKSIRRTQKWYKKLVFHLIYLAITECIFVVTCPNWKIAGMMQHHFPSSAP